MVTTEPDNHFSPATHLQILTKRFPQFPKNITSMWQDRGHSLPDWPSWCFLPMAGWYAIISQALGVSRLLPHDASWVSKLAAVGTWRYSQGIYQFHPELLNALLSTSIDGILPARVLYRLPEWCLYLTLPPNNDLAFDGFWVHLECDANTNRHELRILLNNATLTPLILHLADEPLQSCLNRALEEASTQASQHGFNYSIPKPIETNLTNLLQKLLPLILYLCSDEPDISAYHSMTDRPHYPRPIKTKKGWRFFPPAQPRTWKVGEIIGEKLSTARTSFPLTHLGPRPHLRRAHWHGYWRGPKDAQTFFYRWLPPIFIGENQPDSP